jgi:hypothetical protein
LTEAKLVSQEFIRLGATPAPVVKIHRSAYSYHNQHRKQVFAKFKETQRKVVD